MVSTTTTASMKTNRHPRASIHDVFAWGPELIVIAVCGAFAAALSYPWLLLPACLATVKILVTRAGVAWLNAHALNEAALERAAVTVLRREAARDAATATDTAADTVTVDGEVVR